MADGTNSYLHPGVYIKEMPSTPTIQGASTSTPVFIGATERVADQDKNAPRLVVGWADYQARYGSLVWSAYVASAVYEFFVGGGAQCYVIAVAGAQPGSTAGLATATVKDVLGDFVFNAASAGAWPNQLLNVSIVSAGPSGYFNINVVVGAADLETSTTTISTRLLNAYISNNAVAATSVQLKAGAGLGYILESFGPFTASSIRQSTKDITCPLQIQINARSMFIRVSSAPVAAAQTTQKARTGAADTFDKGAALTFNSTMYQSALSTLASIPDASLIATPDASVVDMTGTDGYLSTGPTSLRGVIASVMTACANLPNLFYVIDAPYENKPVDTTNIVNFVGGGTRYSPLSYENAAIYYPWPFVLNALSGTNVPTPPSGSVLGCYAGTDLNAGVHVSPAGVVNGRITTAMGLTVTLTDSDQDQLNPHGINAIRIIRSYGIAVYGARTLSVGSEWQYVAVRRFVTFVEQSLQGGLQWVVFQPNSELLWATVVLEVTAFLTTLWQQGALFGSTPEDAFFVTCDNTNNPPDQRAKGILYVDVGLAVVYPAEFVVLRIAQKTSTPSASS